MYGGQPICVNGCTYVPDSEAAKTVRYEDELDSSIFTGSSSWKPNGAECSAENHPQPWDPQKPTCKTVPGGGFNHCTEPSGRNCVTSSQGRRMCWEPNEYGERMTADGKEGANRQPPGTPAPPPKAMENPQQAGSVTNTTNNSTSTTTVFNGGGNSGGQGNVGTGGKEGSGSGGDGEGIDFGSSGPGLGTLFEGEGHTEESVAAQIYTAAQGADIARGLVHFFQVPSSGACPTWSLPSTDFWDSMTIDQHCAGDFAAMLAACGWVVLAAIGFLAFRIAFY